jgi:alkanesulfonate monooxygenase SsuD/methylene tetrahydromethanopterin reductase-like flavin-dependent oxidoreductase (luciferase family)
MAQDKSLDQGKSSRGNTGDDTGAAQVPGPHPWVAEAQQRIRFGLFGGSSSGWSAARDWVQAAEELGFDSVWIADHPIGFRFDCWTMLALLAGATRRVRLGPLVSCIYYRGAGLLARQAADVDAASEGRLVLGLGIGDSVTEFAQLGMALPPVAARQRALEEHLLTVPRLLRGEAVSYAGEAVRCEQARLAAGAVQQPRVPILLAGGGEKVTLRQVAQYADASNFGPMSVAGSAWTPDDVQRKHAVLDEHCARFGRSPASVLRTHISFGLRLVDGAGAGAKRSTLTGLFGGAQLEALEVNPDQAGAYFRALVAVGVNYFIVSLGTDPTILRRFAQDVVPAVATSAGGK